MVLYTDKDRGAESRLQSRHSFPRTVEKFEISAKKKRLELWNHGKSGGARKVELPSGNLLKCQ